MFVKMRFKSSSELLCESFVVIMAMHQPMILGGNEMIGFMYDIVLINVLNSGCGLHVHGLWVWSVFICP